MGKRFICPRGHAWEADDALAPADCPVCCSAGIGAEDPTLGPSPPGGELPPAPDGYEILRELGRGGMGVVFQARETALGRVVALKMILSGRLASEEERARFLREATAIAHLRHPNIVAIHHVGEAPGGVPFFTLEYCDGGSLADRVGRPCPPRDAAALIETLARAVQHAHDAGIVHRDLKPANVLLTLGERGVLTPRSGASPSPGDSRPPLAQDVPKIADFGLARRDNDARLTASGAILGTPAYMAPEQANQSRAAGPLADVYALGAILYELLTGRPPFQGPTTADVILKVISDEPAPPRRVHPAVPRDLDVICRKCLQKRPADRYATAAELADDLRRHLDGEPIRARPRWALPRALRRNRWLVVSLMLGSLILIGSSYWVVRFVQGRRSEAIRLAVDEAFRLKDTNDRAAAVEAFTKAIRLDPAYADGYAHRGWLHHELGAHDRAMADYAEAIRRNPAGLWGYRGRGYIHLVRGEYAAAVDDLTEAIPLQPKDSSLPYYRARALVALRRWPEALADLEATLKLRESGTAYQLACIAHTAEGHWQLAVADLRHAARMDPASFPPGAIRFAAAAAALGLGDLASYRRECDRLIALAEADGGPLEAARAARACSLAEQPADPARVRRLAEAALRAFPNNPFSLHIHGLALLRDGEPALAAKAFQAALAAPSGNQPLNQLGLALAEARLGRQAEAKRALAEAERAGVPVGHPHDTMEYQFLLPQARKAVGETGPLAR